MVCCNQYNAIAEYVDMVGLAGVAEQAVVLADYQRETERMRAKTRP